MGVKYLAIIDHMHAYGSITAHDARELYGLSPPTFRGMIRDLRQVVQIESIIEIDSRLVRHRLKDTTRRRSHVPM